MDQRLSIVTLAVADMARAKVFYLDGLGWTEVRQQSTEVCFIQMPGMILGLYGWEPLAEDMAIPVAHDLPQFRGYSLAYNTSSDAETDEVITAWVAAGATLVKAAEKVFWGGYSGYVSDPDGHMWEIAHNPFTLPDPETGAMVMADEDE